MREVLSQIFLLDRSCHGLTFPSVLRMSILTRPAEAPDDGYGERSVRTRLSAAAGMSSAAAGEGREPLPEACRAIALLDLVLQAGARFFSRRRPEADELADQALERGVDLVQALGP